MKDTPDLTTHEIEFKPKRDAPISPADWVAQAELVRQAVARDGLASNSMNDALNGFRFVDETGQSWTYNGTGWLTWNGTAWVAGSPPPALHLQPFKLEWMGDVPPAAAAPASAAKPAVPAPPAPPHLDRPFPHRVESGGHPSSMSGQLPPPRVPGSDSPAPSSGGHLPPPPPPPAKR